MENMRFSYGTIYDGRCRSITEGNRPVSSADARGGSPLQHRTPPIPISCKPSSTRKPLPPNCRIDFAGFEDCGDVAILIGLMRLAGCAGTINQSRRFAQS